MTFSSFKITKVYLIYSAGVRSIAVTLPKLFVQRMQDLLGEEFPAFMASYEEPRYYGLRMNPLKVEKDDFLRACPFRLSPVPWAEEGFYYEEGERPGKHPFYHTGLYYIQEPSAMVPVELLDVKPGEAVLDLCAAPGGKTTQIAGKLRGSGLLVANDNQPDRVKALAKNIELFGVRNAVVLNEVPERMAPRFAGFFDKILIDAPCSGEGMFRKDEDMVRHWDEHTVAKYSAMQQDILHHASVMVKPGGRIVYSTCTFSPEENEWIIAGFLDGHPHFRVVPIPLAHGLGAGRPDWVPVAGEAFGGAGGGFSRESAEAAAGTARLWPHRLRGEGHYAAVLERVSDVEDEVQPISSRHNPGIGSAEEFGAAESKGRVKRSGGKRKQGGRPETAAPVPISLEPWQSFQRDQLGRILDGIPVVYGETLFLGPHGIPDLAGLKVARPGWHVGSLRRGRFEPSHALAMGLHPDEVSRVLPMAADSGEIIRYLKGETLSVEESRILRAEGESAKGYVLVSAGGFSVGWGKWADGMLKNEYPAAWRWI